MVNESLYSIIVELPKEKNNYLREITENVAKRMYLGHLVDNFHLTIEPTLCCCDKGLRFNLSNWLEMQSPLELTLDKVDRFDSRKRGLIYLTTNDKEERERLSDLHYGIHEIIKSRYVKKQNNMRYLPHVTLLPFVPLEKMKELRSNLSTTIEPFKITISDVLVNKRVDKHNWKNFGRFNLGGCNWQIDDFTEYHFLEARTLAK